MLFLSIFILPEKTKSQNDTIPSERQTFGAFFNYNLNTHNVNFRSLPEIPNCCPQFNKGNGKGLSLGLSYELPLPFSTGIGLRVSYSQIGAKLSSNESTLIKVDTTIIQGLFEHTINSKINVLNINPYIVIKPFNFINLIVGGYAGYLLQKDFEQKESIIEPLDRGVFVDTERRTRNEFSGEIKQTNSVNAGINFGVSLDFSLNKQRSLLISPEAFYFQGLSELVKDRFWKIDNISFGLSLKYSPLPAKPKPPEDIFKKINRIIIDTLIVIKDDIDKTFIKTGKEIKTEARERTDKNVVTITEITNRTDTLFKKSKPVANLELNTPLIFVGTRFVTQAFPLLPIIFFKPNSDEFEYFYNIKSRTEEFDESKLEISSLNFHHNILSIVGSRLRSNPKASIKISGFADSTSEKSDCGLARRRAEKIKNYLIDVWNIEANRLNITTKDINCSPNEPTQSRNDSGFAENRRVELSSEDHKILTPITRKMFLENLELNPKTLVFSMDKSTKVGIKSWNLQARQNNRTIFSKNGIGSPPQKIEESINQFLKNGLISNYPLEIEFSITDNENQKEIFATKLPVRIDTSDIEVQRLSLILFGIASDRVPDNSKNNLADFIKENYKSGEAKIYGFTDILGNPALNKTLSEARADNVAKVLKDIAPDIKISEKVGLAAERFPPGIESYSTPPERFLSRTVYIEFLKKWK